MMNGIKVLLSATLLSLFAFGCCCSEKADDAAKCDEAKTGEAKCDDSKAKTVKRAETPDGDVVYVVTVWDAEAVCPCPDSTACKSAQCWEGADGKTYCAKPLKDATDKDKAEKAECYKTSDGKMKAVDNSETAGKDGKATEWCVKQVNKCPKNGDAAACKVEHVKMKDGNKGCAKADAKCADKKADATTADAAPQMEDDVEEDDFFFAVTD